jgi:ectoine hydroxylase-related dioxygenase (phytanoyl-CoA dioxygenase family)
METTTATSEILATLEREGFALVPGVLDPGEVAELRGLVDRAFDDPKYAANIYSDIAVVRLFETDRLFEEMLTREPIIGLMEAILGDDCHLIAQNAVRNPSGRAIDNFHVDDLVHFPVGEGMERHDQRAKMPVLVATAQIPLTDVPSTEYGPTQFVPGSHYSGGEPDSIDDPSFDGRGPVDVLCRAGDMYLQNGQCWHRGAPNTSSQTRYLFQMAYAKRFVAQRFYPFVNYHMPEEILARADPRRRRVLGEHPKGAYG